MKADATPGPITLPTFPDAFTDPPVTAPLLPAPIRRRKKLRVSSDTVPLRVSVTGSKNNSTAQLSADKATSEDDDEDDTEQDDEDDTEQDDEEKGSSTLATLWDEEEDDWTGPPTLEPHQTLGPSSGQRQPTFSVDENKMMHRILPPPLPPGPPAKGHVISAVYSRRVPGRVQPKSRTRTSARPLARVRPKSDLTVKGKAYCYRNGVKILC